MADEITLEQGIEAQRQREAEFSRLERQHGLSNKKYKQSVTARSQTERTNVEGSIENQLQQKLVQAYTVLWQRAHEIVEALSFQFFMLGALLMAPAATAMFLFRWLAGNGLHGMWTLDFRGISVPAVPPMSATEFVYRGGKNIIIAIVFLVEWAIIIFVYKLLTDRTFAANLGFQLFSGGGQTLPQ